MIHEIYLIAGEERYLKEEFLCQLKAKLFKDKRSDLDFSQFDAAQCSADEVIACAKTLPFSSPSRLVIVKNPQNFPSQDKETLLEFLKNPPQTACIVLDAEGSFAPFSVLGAIPGNVEVKRFERLKPNELRAWLWREVKKRQLKIDNDAISAIVELTGNDLSALASALEKISLYGVTKAADITREDVEELCGAISTRTGFELLDAIKKNDPDSALRILNTLTRQGNSHFQIIGLLIWHLGRILKAQALSEEKLRVWMDELLETESAMKTGKIDGKTAIELCVVKLASLKR